jgi:hypothetical protein
MNQGHGPLRGHTPPGARAGKKSKAEQSDVSFCASGLFALDFPFKSAS